jgi:hypothetical protein
MYLTTEGLAVKILERKSEANGFGGAKPSPVRRTSSIDTNLMDLISRPSIILDDAPRMVLAGGELSGINTWNSNWSWRRKLFVKHY